MKVELEELKKENECLQKALQEMEKHFPETKTLLMIEREKAIKEGHEDVHNIQAPIFDDQLMTKITVENEQLKVMDLVRFLLYPFMVLLFFPLISFFKLLPGVGKFITRENR